MTILITCGAAWEPVDGMRRLTNASTGSLGTHLANACVARGWRVVLFRAETATAPLPVDGVERIPFSTNDDLADRLRAFQDEAPDVILHAAALCDFRVCRAIASDGRELGRGKIPTRGGRVSLELEPATKVLPQLRKWFPSARLVGWKYEVEGDVASASAAGWRQIDEARTDACVLNGPAWGEGFGWCRHEARTWVRLSGVGPLADQLVGWIREFERPVS